MFLDRNNTRTVFESLFYAKEETPEGYREIIENACNFDDYKKDFNIILCCLEQLRNTSQRNRELVDMLEETYNKTTESCGLGYYKQGFKDAFNLFMELKN